MKQGMNAGHSYCYTKVRTCQLWLQALRAACYWLCLTGKVWLPVL